MERLYSSFLKLVSLVDTHKKNTWWRNDGARLRQRNGNQWEVCASGGVISASQKKNRLPPKIFRLFRKFPCDSHVPSPFYRVEPKILAKWKNGGKVLVLAGNSPLNLLSINENISLKNF